jgi:RNA polymerase sigma factor (sigma-70 family)
MSLPAVLAPGNRSLVVVPQNSTDGYSHLIERLGNGDPTARAALIERSQERLRVRVSQMLARYPVVHRYHATSDVLQEVLIDLNGALSRLTPRNVRHFLGLAGQRIRWKLLDLARRPAQSYHPTDGLLEDAEETTYDPVRLAKWEEIHNYIHQLPDEERELFDLIFYQGVPQPMVAEMLGIPYRTLKHRWQEARLRFMEHFDEGPF